VTKDVYRKQYEDLHECMVQLDLCVCVCVCAERAMHVFATHKLQKSTVRYQMGMFQMLRVYNLRNFGLHKVVTRASKALT